MRKFASRMYVYVCVYATNVYVRIIIAWRLIKQEEQNRGKPNWEHLTDELHVLLTVEDTENRATLKLARAVEEVKKLLVPVVRKFQLYTLPLFIDHNSPAC